MLHQMHLFTPQVHLYRLESHPACDLSFWLLGESFLCLSRQLNCYLRQTLPEHGTLQLLSGALANIFSQGIAYFFTTMNVLASGSRLCARGAPSALVCLLPTGSCHCSCPLPASGRSSSLPHVPGKITVNLPFCVLPGELAGSTQSAARPGLNQ